MTVRIDTKALDGLDGYFASLPDIAEKAMGLAINQVAERDGLALLKRDMREQVDFPAGYLETGPKGPRLGPIGRKAGKGSLERIIRGRDRGTSLARFAPGQTPSSTRKLGVRVTVKPGRMRHLKHAFLMKLRNGNTGLAVRLKAGDTSLANSRAAVSLGNNLYLLYGPSVDQVFQGVAADRVGDIGSMVRKQFLRQFSRLNNRG